MMSSVLKIGIAVTLSAAVFAIVIITCLWLANVVGKNMTLPVNEYDVTPIVSQ